jgi:hypothetical protein
MSTARPEGCEPSDRTENSGSVQNVQNHFQTFRTFGSCRASSREGTTSRRPSQAGELASKTSKTPVGGDFRTDHLLTSVRANEPAPRSDGRTCSAGGIAEPGRPPRRRACVAWRPCGALSRSSGRPCRAEGSGIGGRCRHHGGLTLPSAPVSDPKRTWTLLVTSSGVAIEPSQISRGRWPAERKRFAARWPQDVRPWVAVRLAASGRVHEALLWRGGEWLLRAVAEKGARIEIVFEAMGVTRVRFARHAKETR